MTVVAWWLLTFGVWPLAHPRHDTFGDLMTWLDLALHATGVVMLIRLRGERLRLAWNVYLHGIPTTLEYEDGTRYEWKRTV